MRKGIIVDCNEAAVELVGYPNKQALINTTPEDLSPPIQPNGKSSNEEIAKNGALARKKGSHSFDWVRLKYDGSTVLIEVSLTLLIIEGEEYMHALWRDKAKLNLTKHSQSLEEYFETMHDPHFILKDGVFKQCNQAAVEFLCVANKAEILQKEAEHFFPNQQPDNTPSSKKFDQLIQQVRSEGSSTFQWCFKTPNGTNIFTSMMITIATTDNTEEIHLTCHDETPQLEAHNTALKELLNRMGDASVLLKDGKIVDCNHTTVELLGYPNKHTLLQTHPTKLHPEFQPDGSNSVEKANAVLSREAGESSTFIEWTLKKYNGDLVHIEIMVTPVEIDNEHFTHVIWRDLTAKKSIEAEVTRLAYQDHLTGLANRRSLVKRLEHVISNYKRTKHNGALLFIDLDHFKNINDTFGHEVGDELLKQVSRKLITSIREGDTVARFGGDEFVIMLEDVDDQPVQAANKAEIISEKILADINRQYTVLQHRFSMTASIGVSMFSTEADANDLLKRSDIALYQAKKEGRNTICFYDPIMQEAINERAHTVQLIETALANDQFELHYQLQVDANRAPTGAEALLRLKHPEKGYVPPLKYIPIAEETGLMLRIGNWVLETACKQLASWAKQPTTKQLILSVNISPLQFIQSDFVDSVINTVKNTGANPKLLKLELTETMMVENIDDIILKMRQLKEKQIQFSVDDFGTGYSSLQYLRKLPLSQLKIDRSFVMDLEQDAHARSIVQTIIAMGNALNLNVIAEGVETQQQQQILLDYGCTNYQGFLFAKPVTIDELKKQLADETIKKIRAGR